MGTACQRWTNDTEQAFLLALRVEGQVTRAAFRIGRTPGVCYQRKRISPAFAEGWDALVKELEEERRDEAEAATEAAEAGEPPVLRRLTRSRRDGWTGQRQRAFLRALADTGSYGKAAAAVGLSREAARRFRARSREFEAKCEQALREGGTTLADAAYARAVEGWEEPVFHGGKLVGHRRRYSDTLLRQLLREEAVVHARDRQKWRRPRPIEEVRESILTKIDAMVRHRQAQERKVAVAQADDWRARGLIP